MKQIFLFCIVCFLCSCSDGDIQIETLDFDSVTAQTCDAITTDTQLFFKINDDEAIILTLQSGVLKNEVTTENIISTVPSQSKIIYRIFTDKVSKGYFCDEIRPISPDVLQEIEAESGEVIISTVAGDNGSFVHTISLQNISLVAANGNRITDQTINEFGTVTTTP